MNDCEPLRESVPHQGLGFLICKCLPPHSSWDFCENKMRYWLKLEAADHSVDGSCYYSSWPFGLCDLLSARALLLGPQDYPQQGRMNCCWDSCEERRPVNGRLGFLPPAQKHGGIEGIPNLDKSSESRFPFPLPSSL